MKQNLVGRVCTWAQVPEEVGPFRSVLPTPNLYESPLLRFPKSDESFKTFIVLEELDEDDLCSFAKILLANGLVGWTFNRFEDHFYIMPAETPEP